MGIGYACTTRSATGREALIVLWEASDRICGKRLKPLLPMLVSALERHGNITLESTARARLLAASAATLDRLLRPTRESAAGSFVHTLTLTDVRPDGRNALRS